MIQTFFIQNTHLRRSFEAGPAFLRTSAFQALADGSDLLQSPPASEGSLRLNGREYLLGGDCDEFRYLEHHLIQLPAGGQRLEISLAAPSSLPGELRATLLYEAPGNAPVLIKSIRLDNDSDTAIHLDGAQVEAFIPVDRGELSLMLDDDFVRDAQTISGRPARSPWIEEHQVYVSHMLTTQPDPTKFAYPHALDTWLLPGDRFNSFRVFEFVLPRQDEFARGLAWRRATRALWPWTRRRFLGCYIAPAVRIDE
jgi:hypothetical protein